jgi:uncharacterized protein YwgA
MSRSALILSAIRSVRQFQGRVKVQKILYFADLCGWNTIRDYRYYNYGPYSDTVTSELENFRRNGWVEERPFTTRDEKVAYSYLLTKRGQKVADSLAARLDNPGLVKRTMSLVRILHMFSSDDLEIMATLVFLRRSESSLSDDQLIDRVAELKPRFERSRIADNLKIFNILKNYGYAA